MQLLGLNWHSSLGLSVNAGQQSEFVGWFYSLESSDFKEAVVASLKELRDRIVLKLDRPVQRFTSK